jgi:hypothetical protein
MPWGFNEYHANVEPFKIPKEDNTIKAPISNSQGGQ